MRDIDFMEISAGIWIAWAVYWLIASMNVQKTESSEGLLSSLNHRIPLILGMIMIFRPSFIDLGRHSIYQSSFPCTLGIALTFIGLSISVYARKHLGKYWSGIITLKQDHLLIRSGPYQISRHPIYTCLLLAGAGSALSANSIAAFIGCVFLTVGFLAKIKREEMILKKHFGNDYKQFQKDVKKLIPFIF